MKIRREVLKSRTIILLAGAMAILTGTATGAWAGNAKAPPADQGWYFHGKLNVGGRFYAERPGDGFGYNADGSFQLPTQTESRAGWEKYGKVPAGLFLDWINLDAGSKDGRYRFNFWGDDVGYNAQSYTLDFSEAGKQYLSLGWSQTPHLYSYSGKSLFYGVGTTNLTVNDVIQTQLHLLAPGSASMNNYINSHATQIDQMSVRRDKFSAAYRYTPTPNWDFRASYSHEDRTGTRPSALDYSPGTSFPGNSIGVPYPVDDTTQSPAASGEYDGVSSWGGRYSFKLGYAGSIYTDHLAQLDVENPFGQTGGVLNYGPGTLRVPLPPSNQAHAITFSGAMDLPVFKSRFTTTDQWDRHTQNAAFVDTANNGAATSPLPVSSLNGKVVNFLTNNVLTSDLTSTLHNKIRVRYYDHDNRTTSIQFGTVLLADSETTVPDATEYTSYKKTNVDEDLTWNPVRWFTLGAGYGYERWDRSDNRFVERTDENIGRMFAVTQLTDWAKWRVSYSYGDRSYKGQYAIDDTSWLNTRMFDLAPRHRNKAKSILTINVGDSVTITPTAGLRWDDYPEDAINETGLQYDHSWNAGVDVGWAVSPALRLMVGYNYAEDKLNLTGAVPAGSGVNPICKVAPLTTVPASCIWAGGHDQTYNTLVTSVHWMAVPQKLDFGLRYSASWERDSQTFSPCSINDNNCNGGSTNPAAVGLPWPDVTNLYQRLDATARYHFDKQVVRRMGWTGKVVAKLRYTWARNDQTNWQIDNLSPYIGALPYPTGATSSTFLAYNNPNYTVQMIAGSLTFKW